MMKSWDFSFCGLPVEIRAESSWKIELPNYLLNGVSLPVRFGRSKTKGLRIEILNAPLPKDWAVFLKRKCTLVDTESTWALYETNSKAWPYLFGFSPKKNTELRIPNVLASRDFSTLRVYLSAESGVISSDQIFPLDEVIFRHFLASYPGLLVHGASVVIDGEGCVFLGDSGAGKSTIAELIEGSDTNSLVLTDDRTVILPSKKGYEVFGTPWHGTLPRFAHQGAPLKRLFFIEQARAHSLTPLSSQEAFEKLFKVFLGAWWIPSLQDLQLKTLEKLIFSPQVSCHRLAFAKDPSIGDFVVDLLHGRKREEKHFKPEFGPLCAPS